MTDTPPPTISPAISPTIAAPVGTPPSGPASAPPNTPPNAPPPPEPGVAGSVATTTLSGPVWIIGAALVGALSVASITLALYGQQRIKALEQELVRRQQDSQGQAIEARALAQQAQDMARAADTKVGLLDARVAETALQRTQLEELIQQLSRSRDENVLADVDAAVRVAVQQSTITGSAEPMIAALRQAEERLGRMSQPRLERVRRALARDIDRVKAVAVTDIASLTIKLDEAVRGMDELPLVSQPERLGSRPQRASAAATPAVPASSASAPGTDWMGWAAQRWAAVAERVWGEVRGLVRVNRIDNNEAVLLAPDQAWFLRENLKLRLLNARLALLSRQYDTVQNDLHDALGVIDRYFDRGARRVVLARDLIQQVAGQARQIALPRPDETLAAIAAAQAGR